MSGDLPAVPPQQAEDPDGRGHTRHAGRPAAADRGRPAAPSLFDPPGPERFAQVRPHELDRAHAPVRQPIPQHIVVLRRKLFRERQDVRNDGSVPGRAGRRVPVRSGLWKIESFISRPLNFLMTFGFSAANIEKALNGVWKT